MALIQSPMREYHIETVIVSVRIIFESSSKIVLLTDYHPLVSYSQTQ